MSGRRPRHLDQAGPAPGRRKGRFLAGALTVGAHVLILTALVWPRPVPRPPHFPPPPPPIQVSLVELPRPTPPGPNLPNFVQPGAVKATLPRLAPARIRAVVVAVSPMHDDMSDVLSASQLAGATSVGNGGGGGGTCDMAEAVQRALRKDPMVRSAVNEAHRAGKAIMIWNGDWVRNGIQDGKGLSAVREAIMWEVGFAPAQCRNMPMHGLVLLSLDGGTRFAVGAGEWRWGDLLGVHGAQAERE